MYQPWDLSFFIDARRSLKPPRGENIINDCWKEVINIELRFKLLKDNFFSKLKSRLSYKYEMDKYWRLYRNLSLMRKPIRC